MSDAAGRRIARGVLLFSLGLAGYYFLFGGEYDLADVGELRAARSESLVRLDSLRAVLDSVRGWGDRLESDPAAIERVARERHSYIREGEVLVKFVGDEEEADTTPGG